MRYLLYLLALFVETGLVLGTPYERNGIIYDGRPEPRKARHEVRDLAAEAAALDNVAICANSYNLFTTGTGPAPTGTLDPLFDYLSFCSAFIQPTQTLTSTSYYSTTLTVAGRTSTVTAVTTSTTKIAGGSGTAVATCPIPAPSMICGQGGWGYATNNIYSTSGIDAVACHELCLANSACQSFQVETNTTTTSPTCNLYKVDPSGNNTIVSTASPFTFFSRDCPDHVPDACTGGGSPVVSNAPPPTTSTTGPFSIITPPALVPHPLNAFVERAEAEKAVTLPWFLQPFGSAILSEICSCIYTRPVAATTVVGILPKTTTVYVSANAKTVTALVTVVVTVGGGQLVTSIS